MLPHKALGANVWVIWIGWVPGERTTASSTSARHVLNVYYKCLSCPIFTHIWNDTETCVLVRVSECECAHMIVSSCMIASMFMYVRLCLYVWWWHVCCLLSADICVCHYITAMCWHDGIWVWDMFTCCIVSVLMLLWDCVGYAAPCFALIVLLLGKHIKLATYTMSTCWDDGVWAWDMEACHFVSVWMHLWVYLGCQAPCLGVVVSVGENVYLLVWMCPRLKVPSSSQVAGVQSPDSLQTWPVALLHHERQVHHVWKFSNQVWGTSDVCVFSVAEARI